MLFTFCVLICSCTQIFFFLIASLGYDNIPWDLPVFNIEFNCYYSFPCLDSHHPREVDFLSYPKPQATTGLLLVSINLAIRDISSEWNYTIYGLLWLTSSTFKCVLKFTHVVASISILLFYCWIVFHYMATPHFVHLITSWEIWTVSTFWLLWLMLLWTFV